MNIRGITSKDKDEWPGCIRRIFRAPSGMEDKVELAEALESAEAAEIHVAWQPDEIDLVRLAHGGTVWLTTLGGLPPHRLEVRGGER